MHAIFVEIDYKEQQQARYMYFDTDYDETIT